MNQEPDAERGPLRQFTDPDYVPLCDTLSEVRDNIDELDRQIVGLLAERGRYVKDAARFKKDPFQVSAPARQQQVIDKVTALAIDKDAYPEVVEACYRAMIAGFIAREQRDFTHMTTIEENT